jgi:hypothetical protein
VVGVALALLAGGFGVGVAHAASTPPPGAHASIPPDGGGVSAQSVSGPNVAPGYWEVDSAGDVSAFGTIGMGDLSGTALNSPIVGMAPTPDGGGYWLVAADGGIFSFGDAQFYGSTGNLVLNQPIVGMASTPDGHGYWLVAADGGIFAFGDAAFYGSTGNITLNRPIVGMASTPDGHGYWLVASDGGIFAFGDAAFYGSTGNITLNQPIVGMAAAPGGAGYWLVASDGGIFSFGHVGFFGSAGDLVLDEPIVGMAATADGQGYWLVAADGGIFTYGDATYLGSAVGSSGASVVSIAATTHASPLQSSSLGYDISWPQCNGSTAASLPPAGSSDNIIGVNDGYSPVGAANNGAAEFNPCFKAQASWAGSGLSVYINMDNLTQPASLQAATADGVTDAADDYNFVTKVEGFHPQIWWLDVEGPDGVLWQGPGNSDGNPFAYNLAVIQGAISELHALGLTVGIYCTYLQWPEIAGTGAVIPQIPIWIAGAADAEQTVDYCTDPARSFADGTPYLVQWGGGNGQFGNQTPWDEDYACTP